MSPTYLPNSLLRRLRYAANGWGLAISTEVKQQANYNGDYSQIQVSTPPALGAMLLNKSNKPELANVDPSPTVMLYLKGATAML